MPAPTAVVFGGLVLSIVRPGPSLSAQQANERIWSDFEEAAAAYADSANLPGLALGVVLGDSLAWEIGLGLADRVTGRGVDANTLFQIGSVSKTFTATLLARLLADGVLSLEDPIARHLPSELALPVPDRGTPITVRHLATHGSGLPRQPPTLRREHDDYPVLAFTHFELYRSLEGSELSFVPGTRWDYTNFGYAVLGHVLERATGTPYEVLLEERIFEPLGMESSTVTIWPELEPRLARPYYPAPDGRLEPYTPWDMEALAPAGGIASTVADLGRYLAVQMGDPALRARTWAGPPSPRWETR